MEVATVPVAFSSDPQATYEIGIGVLSSRLVTGLGTLTETADLDDVAQRQASAMAAAGVLWHNPYLEQMVPSWVRVGEIVGSGPSVGSVYGAWMTSWGHRKVVLNPWYTQFGVGTARRDDGVLFTAVVFRRPG